MQSWLAYHSLGDFKKAIEYYNLDLKIAKEVGNKHGEGKAYCNLGLLITVWVISRKP